MTSSITEASRATRTLADLEAVIERGLETFVEVGLALLEIRDARLYLAAFSTFEDYCRERWGFDRTRAQHLITAAEISETLKTFNSGSALPANDAQARALIPLKTSPEMMAGAWMDAQTLAIEGQHNVTAADVREAVDRRLLKPQAEAAAERRERYEQQAVTRGASVAPDSLPFDRIIQADALSYLKLLPDGCVDLCVTSPPYLWKRIYSAGSEEIGDEEEPTEYLDTLRTICEQIGRVLTPQGWLYLNVGDTFGTKPGQYRGNPDRAQGISDKARAAAQSAPGMRQWDVPDKSLVLVPWRLVTALVMQDGWRCRNVIAWHKLGHQPENVFDRLTQAWEPVFALTRAAYPYFDRAADAERPTDVWDIPVGRGGAGGTHPAVFPNRLVERAIALACPSSGVVLDCFAGSGTVLAVARGMGRRFLGCDLLDWQAVVP